MSYGYQCSFNLDDCIKKLGLNERGRVQKVVANEVMRVCDPYVPFDEGYLRDSVHMESGGEEVVYDGPYAQYLYGGKVWEDPELHCAGFQTENGWYSRNGARKVPTDRDLTFQGAPVRGAHWVDRAMQAGGTGRVEEAARKAVNK